MKMLVLRLSLLSTFCFSVFWALDADGFFYHDGYLYCLKFVLPLCWYVGAALMLCNVILVFFCTDKKNFVYGIGISILTVIQFYLQLNACY
jgi:hypothetical protein